VSSSKTWMRAWVGLVLTLWLAAPGAQAQTAPPATGEAAAPEATPIEPAAVDALRRAGDFLRSRERFTFDAELGYEVVQPDGHKLEFGATRRFWVERPDRARIEAEDRDGRTTLVVFDGQAFSASEPRRNVYAQAVFPSPRDLDDAVAFARRALALPLPLGELLENDPNEAMMAGLTHADLVGVARIGGVPCDHVAISNPETDAQLWIAQGDEPTLRRVVITYRSTEGAPAFWANLGGWSFPKELAADRFRFEPPKGAERIPFALRAEPRVAAAATGEQP
jgi:hypothetical protein